MTEESRGSFDQVALRISNDDGKTWGPPQTLKIQGLDLQRYQRPMDPAILQLPDGRFRLYFTSSDRMQPGPGRPWIYSAISSDLREFIFEEGVRSDRADSPVVDASVVFHDGTFFMVAHPERRVSPFDVRQGYFATSGDGVSFLRRRNLGVSFEGDFIGNLFSSQGRLFFFGGGPRGIWSMSSKDGNEWTKPALSGLRGGDPSLFVDAAGKQWIVYVGGVRQDAVRELPWMPRQRGPGPGRGSDNGRGHGGGNNVGVRMQEGGVY
jgi:hypothetical protein